MTSVHALALQGFRDRMEDAHGLLHLPGGGEVYVVADGVGGERGGDRAALTSVRAALDAARALPSSAWDDPEGCLRAAVHAANSAVRECRTPDAPCPSTTLLLVHVAPGPTDYEVTVAWVGDSRAYAWVDGRLKRLTRDHSVAERPDLIPPGAHAPRPEHLVAVVEGEQLAAVGVRRLRLPAGARLLAATDGVWKVLGQALELLLWMPDPATATRWIARGVSALRGADNATGFVIYLGPRGPAATEPRRERAFVLMGAVVLAGVLITTAALVATEMPPNPTAHAPAAGAAQLELEAALVDFEAAPSDEKRARLWAVYGPDPEARARRQAATRGAPALDERLGLALGTPEATWQRSAWSPAGGRAREAPAQPRAVSPTGIPEGIPELTTDVALTSHSEAAADGAETGKPVSVDLHFSRSATFQIDGGARVTAHDGAFSTELLPGRHFIGFRCLDEHLCFDDRESFEVGREGHFVIAIDVTSPAVSNDDLRIAGESPWLPATVPSREAQEYCGKRILKVVQFLPDDHVNFVCEER